MSPAQNRKSLSAGAKAKSPATTDRKGDKLNKRKRDSGGKGEAEAAQKKLKSVALKPSRSAPLSKGNAPSLVKHKQPHAKQEDSLSKRESRLRAKEVTEARKKRRKRHFNLEQELALLWEKMRRRNIEKEERSKFITEALIKMKGVIHEIAASHVSSRVLQTCVKYCSEAERNKVYAELQPHFLTLACNKYAVHLVNKMLDSASKKQLAGFISSLRGHVASLLRHVVGSAVIEHAYQLGSGAQKREMLLELYSTELQLFKDLSNIKESRLLDIIPKLGFQKSSVSRHMTSVLQPILEKGIVDHSIIHKAMLEYLSIADQTSAADVLQQLSGPLLVRMIHTRDGSKLGILCVKHGSAKERKKIIKGMKGHIVKTANDNCGALVLACIFSTVDDTKLLSKVVIQELQSNLKELVLEKNGRRPILQLLHPFCHRYFSPDDLASLDSFVPSLHSKDGEESQLVGGKQEIAVDEEEDDVPASSKAAGDAMTDESVALVKGGKKDPLIRRQELLVNSGLAEKLIDTCIESAEELLMSNFGKEVLYEVARGGSDGILLSSLADKLTSLYEQIASLVAKPKSDESEHLLENFHSNRTIRRLVLDCPAFASVLWKSALQGKCKEWAKGHSSKVISAFMESADSSTHELAKPELQPLVDNGVLTLPEPKKVGKDD
ncbi:hypothetical protein V2J09_011411 [Rumex salicifolius]